MNMLKIRIQGTTNDIKWFLRLMSRNRQYTMNNPSEPMDINGSQRYKRVYTEVFRDKDEYSRYISNSDPKKRARYIGTGVIFGSEE